MHLTRIVQIIGIIILFGLTGPIIYAFQSASEVDQILETSPSITLDDGDSPLITEDRSDLHLHDTYYIVISPSYFMIAFFGPRKVFSVKSAKIFE